MKLKKQKKEQNVLTEGPVLNATASPMADIGSGVILTGLALLFYTQLYELEGLGRMFPELLIYFIGLGGLYLIGSGVFKHIRQRRHEGFEETSIKRIAIILIGSIIYAFLTPIFGFYPTSAIFLFIMTVMLKDQGISMRHTIINGIVLSAVMCIVIYLGFTILLNVPTPLPGILD